VEITQVAQLQSALKSVSFVGFLITATLLVGLNFKIFNNIFKDNAKNYWWLFLVISAVPILVAIYIYTFFFGGKA
jgi:hypothetical protein